MNSSWEHKIDVCDELQRALQFHKSGHLQQAEESYRRILESKPDHADALHLLGLVYCKMGNTCKGKTLISQAVAIDSQAPLFYVSLGDVLQAENKHEAAVGYYRKALDLKPDMIQALCNMANALREKGDVAQAIDLYEKCLAVNPHLPDVHNNLGLAQYHRNRFRTAEGCFKEALRLNPHYAEAYNNLGNVYRDQLQFEDAICQYQKALSLMPKNSGIHYNIGLAFQMWGQLVRAQEFYQRTLEMDPTHADAYNNLGKLYHDANLMDAAIEMYDNAIHLDAGHYDARFNRALLLLACARFEEGWREYEWRFKRKEWQKIYPHRLRAPRWDGSDFSGKRLLVHSEQGFGDTIQFIRYLPEVKALGSTVIFEAQRELCKLLEGFNGIDILRCLSFEHPPLQDYDLQIPLMSLPGLFGTTPDAIPASVPYLHASRENRMKWQGRVAGRGLKIGLAWAAKTTYAHAKSCGLENFLPLTDLQGIRIYGLQKDGAAAQIKHFPSDLINLGEEFENFADTAGAIDCLDLIISVDTAVAHLAGAMGKRVWVLLPFAADWRWLTERRDSPWYPTMRLFRQQKPRDWQPVVNQVVAELRQIVEAGYL